jgi:hypothetical protein
VSNPYQKIDDQMATRVSAFVGWARYCARLSRDLYTTLGSRDQKQPAKGQTDVIQQIDYVLSSMRTGSQFQATQASAAGFILNTLNERAAADPVLVEKARAYMACYDTLFKALQKHVLSMEDVIQSTIDQKLPLSSTRNSIDNLAKGCEKFLATATSCGEAKFAAYDNVLQQSKVSWEQQRAQAVQEQVEAEEYAAAMRAQAERMAQAARDAGQAATDSATERILAEQAADEAAAVVEDMDQEAEALDGSPGFPWLLVVFGGVAVVGIGAAVYFSQRG